MTEEEISLAEVKIIYAMDTPGTAECTQTINEELQKLVKNGQYTQVFESKVMDVMSSDETFDALFTSFFNNDGEISLPAEIKSSNGAIDVAGIPLSAPLKPQYKKQNRVFVLMEPCDGFLENLEVIYKKMGEVEIYKNGTIQGNRYGTFALTDGKYSIFKTTLGVIVIKE